MHDTCSFDCGRIAFDLHTETRIRGVYGCNCSPRHAAEGASR
ncbi:MULTISPECIES: hypothetical protein [Xanthomonas]|nr:MULTISPECIES: hypothetical protein [Xanthomonas]MEA9900540.1 hypothetical protein [Xanthomonas campestris pv. raphani]